MGPRVTEAGLKVSRRTIAGATALVLVGELDRATLEDALTLFTSGEGKTGGLARLVDLSRLEFADSSVIALVYELVRRQPENRWVGLISPSPGVMRVLSLGGLGGSAHVRIFRDDEEARAAVSAATRARRSRVQGT